MFRYDHGPRVVSNSRGAGLFRRTYEAMLGARERQARQVASRYILALDDAALDRLGYDRPTLEAQGYLHPL